MLALDTPVPTPDGWTTMGEIVAGQEVFDESGRVCRVTAAYPVRVAEEPYRLTFSDGTWIDACAEHLWCTWTHAHRLRRAAQHQRLQAVVVVEVRVGRCDHEHY
jgi:hypothetical protein